MMYDQHFNAIITHLPVKAGSSQEGSPTIPTQYPSVKINSDNSNSDIENSFVLMSFLVSILTRYLHLASGFEATRY